MTLHYLLKWICANFEVNEVITLFQINCFNCIFQTNQKFRKSATYHHDCTESFYNDPAYMKLKWWNLLSVSILCFVLLHKKTETERYMYVSQGVSIIYVTLQRVEVWAKQNLTLCIHAKIRGFLLSNQIPALSVWLSWLIGRYSSIYSIYSLIVGYNFESRNYGGREGPYTVLRFFKSYPFLYCSCTITALFLFSVFAVNKIWKCPKQTTLFWIILNTVAEKDHTVLKFFRCTKTVQKQYQCNSTVVPYITREGSAKDI